MSLLTENGVLECPYWMRVSYWNVLTGMPLLTENGVLECPYWLKMAYWNVLTG